MPKILSDADQSNVQVIAKVEICGKVDVVFRLVRCRVANRMPFIVKDQACSEYMAAQRESISRNETPCSSPEEITISVRLY